MLTRALLSTVFAAALLSACFRQSPLNASPRPAVTDTLWYVSARARNNGLDTRKLADSLEFGMVVSIVKSGGDPLTNGLDVTPIDSERLSASEFAAALRARAIDTPESDSLAVLMVHGFGTSLHEAWLYASQSHIRSRSPAPWVVFCWPSNGSGAAWPRANQILTRAYHEDSTAAAASRNAFAQSVEALRSAVGGAHLLLVGHSLGAQIVGEALAEHSELRAALVADPLRALAFFSPDVEDKHFDDYVLPAVIPLARRTVVYVASDDRLLIFSRTINKSERVGLIWKTPLQHDGVETVDVTDGASAEDRVQRIVGTHHTMRRASAALFDLMYIVAGGYAANCRTTLRTSVLEPSGVWKLTRMPPPPLTALAACSR